MPNELKRVSREEYEAFIATFPAGRLRGSLVTICEPAENWIIDDMRPSTHPVGSLDRTIDKRVAKVNYEWLGPNGVIDEKSTGEFWKYYIRADSAAADKG